MREQCKAARSKILSKWRVFKQLQSCSFQIVQWKNQKSILRDSMTAESVTQMCLCSVSPLRQAAQFHLIHEEQCKVAASKVWSVWRVLKQLQSYSDQIVQHFVWWRGALSGLKKKESILKSGTLDWLDRVPLSCDCLLWVQNDMLHNSTRIPK